MKFDRTTNAKRNIFWGGINKIVLIIMPFIIRIVIIRKLGAEYLGLDSLFVSILQVLNITELGFSSAIVYCMYKPVAENDENTICELLMYFKKIYRVIGGVIFFIGFALLPFIPYLIQGDYPQSINIYILYLLYLINTVISYFLFAYKSALLTAYQRNDIISNINTIVKIIVSLLQSVAILIIGNYYGYVLALIIGTVINNIYVAAVSKRRFPNLYAKGQLQPQAVKELKKNVKGLFVQKLCAMTRNSCDSIFISAFMGLTQVAMYNNYYYIMNAVTTMLLVIASAISAGVGNSIATETKIKNYMDMKKINFLYMWLSGWCMICLACLYQPFTEIYFGEDMLYPYAVVILFCVYFYMLKMGDIRHVYAEAAGIWWETRYRAVAEAVANLALNYILGKYFGVYGVIIATLVSLFFINFIWGTQIIFRCYFSDISVKEYYLFHILYATVTMGICIFTYFVCSFVTVTGYVGLIVKSVICVVLPNGLYLIVYSKMELFKIAKTWIKGILCRE